MSEASEPPPPPIEQFANQLINGPFEGDIECVLDVLWLATRKRALTLHPAHTERLVPAPVDPDARGVDSTLLEDRGRQSRLNQPGTTTPRDAIQDSGPGQDKDVAPPLDDRTSGGKASVYATGAVSSADRTIKASPITLPASRALPNRLQLTRALRPFRQRWPSSHVQDLDEEATATFTANLRGQFYPVFRPRFEPWFNVNLVSKTTMELRRGRTRCARVQPGAARDGRVSRCPLLAPADAGGRPDREADAWNAGRRLGARGDARDTRRTATDVFRHARGVPALV